jgi:hypothetical protein
MVIRMGWLSKLLGRTAKSEDAQEALEEQYAAEAARPQSEQPPTSEPMEPSEPSGGEQQPTP